MADWAPEEAPSSKPDLESNKLGRQWPKQGGIVFDDVVARYRPELQPALRDLSFKIRAGERVAVVGRTGERITLQRESRHDLCCLGSGKSTLLSALFRKINIEKGQISGSFLFLCGYSRLRLTQLRS